MEGHHLDWHSPKSMILGGDGYFVPIKPETDQVWELTFAPSATQLFYLQTTYGLRARSMHFFPNILLDGKRLTHPDDFAKHPTIKKYPPGSLILEYETVQGLRILFSCFFPNTSLMTGDLTIHNTGATVMKAAIEMAAVLVPMHQGTPTRPRKMGKCTIISGQSGNLYPVLHMSGGPIALTNPYPALSLALPCSPGQSRVVSWALATKDSLDASFKAAQDHISAGWQKECRIQQKFHEAHTLFIQTGDPDWDAALYLSQVSASQHCSTLGDGEDDKFSFLKSRLPDQTASDKIDSNLTLLDAIHLAEVILPAHSKTFEQLVRAFISQVDEKGQLKIRFSHYGIRRSFQAAPLLAQLCLDLYEIHQDRSFLNEIFTDLCRFFNARVTTDSENNLRFHLTWEDPQQLQLNTGLFNFDIWEETGRGLEIQTAESPAMAAMLFREVRSLQKIAAILEKDSQLEEFQNYEKLLKKQFEESWQENLKGYVYLDCQSHLKSLQELYYPAPASEKLDFKKRFTRPQRLQLHLTVCDENTRAGHIQFVGKDIHDETIVENFYPRDIRWISGRAHLVTRQLYTFLDFISIKGLTREDQVLLETANYAQCDITCLSPIWSGGIPKARFQVLVKRHFNVRRKTFRYGVPETWQCQQKLPNNLPIYVNMLWNTLLIKGLVDHGFQEQAMQLFQNLMALVVTGLKNYQGFFSYYSHRDGHPAGTRNAISALVPVRLLLQIAGIRLFSPNRVVIWGKNPFPWPLKIAWQGLTLIRDGTKTNIIFPDGTKYETDSPKSALISASKGLR